MKLNFKSDFYEFVVEMKIVKVYFNQDLVKLLKTIVDRVYAIALIMTKEKGLYGEKKREKLWQLLVFWCKNEIIYVKIKVLPFLIYLQSYFISSF